MYELTQFVEAQHTLQETLTVTLSHFSTDVHVIVRAACDDIVDQFLRQNKIVADHKMTFMERASLRSECRKLTRFLRLTDFIVVDTLQDLALDSVIDAWSSWGPRSSPSARSAACGRRRRTRLRRDQHRRRGRGRGQGPASPLFTVVSSFSDDGQLSVQPTLQTVQEALADVIAQSLKVIGIPERVFTHEELAAYVMAESDDAEELAREETPVQDLVCADEAFRKTSEAIYTHLHAAFADVEEYVQRFAPYKDTFFENHAYTDNIREIYKDVDLKVYRAEIEKYRDQVTDFENDIPYSADIGVIHVDPDDLKMRLVPSPVQCLYALQVAAAELMDAGFKTLLDELQTVLPVVTGNPVTVEAFVTKKKAVQDSLAAFDGYKARQSKLIAMSADGGAGLAGARGAEGELRHG